MKLIIAGLLLIAVLELSCTNKSGSEIKQDLYAEFILALGEESHHKVQCVATFMKDEDFGKKVSLGRGAKVMLDGKEVPYDSTVYPNYAEERDRAVFAGKHEWTVQFPDGQKWNYPFESKPFSITSGVPDTVGKSDITIHVGSLQKSDRIILFLSGDLSDSSENLLEIEPADSSFLIPASFWKNVDPTAMEVHFNISSIDTLKTDAVFTKGGVVERTWISRRYKIIVMR